MNKKGFTLVELVISVGLISVVMLFLFHLLNDMQYEEAHASFAKDNQVNRTTIIHTVQKDFMAKDLLDATLITGAGYKEIDFLFQDTTTTLTIYQDRVAYRGLDGNSEVWLLEKGHDDAYLDIDQIKIDKPVGTCTYTLNIDTNGDGVCDYNCDTNKNGVLDDEERGTSNESYKVCPSFRTIQIIIPVINSDIDNIIDDLEFYYIGKNNS